MTGRDTPATEATPEAPDWCGYPEPTRPVVGCWSLLSGLVTGPEYCADCDARKPDVKTTEIIQPPDRPANKILTGLSEALRIATLIRAVYEIDGFEMTEKEAMEVLAKLDAVS